MLKIVVYSISIGVDVLGLVFINHGLKGLICFPIAIVCFVAAIVLEIRHRRISC